MGQTGRENEGIPRKRREPGDGNWNGGKERRNAKVEKQRGTEWDRESGGSER